ncbi:unnamed protein product, partial (macronuclear) [Paramecium tetraurelia]
KKEIEEMTKRINQKESEVQIFQSQLDQINQEKLEKEKQSNLRLEKIQDYTKTLFFSNIYKGANCQVSQGGKVAECFGDWFYCFCEQAIPKKGKTLFAFQMIDGTQFEVGIGFRDIILKNNYRDSGVGSYLLNYLGYTYSHHNQHANNKKLSFTFTTNDVIIIEVSIEHKYIKWTRQNSPLAVLQIDTSISQELYPCVSINQSKVKILDNIQIDIGN